MTGRVPPTIFSAKRRQAVAARAARLNATTGEQPFLIEHMAEEIADRLDFVRHSPVNSLLLGSANAQLQQRLAADDGRVCRNDQLPMPDSGFDFIASINTLDTINDLPGALIRMHRALASGGLVIATFIGAPSLAHLRRAMLAADGERSSARMHPLVDVRAAAELIQRAGWHSPVVDAHTLQVSYAKLDRLVADLRLHGMTSRLSSVAPPLSRTAAERARQAFLQGAAEDGRVIERFEVLTLSGWRK